MISIDNIGITKCEIQMTSKFKKQLKLMYKQGRNIEELLLVIYMLANLYELDSKYNNHYLINDKTYKDCIECHIRPDWILIYKYINNKLILLLMATGSHSDLFD